MHKRVNDFLDQEDKFLMQILELTDLNAELRTFKMFHKTEKRTATLLRINPLLIMIYFFDHYFIMNFISSSDLGITLLTLNIET